MCDPLVIGGVMAATKALEIHGQNQAAGAQSRALEKSAQTEADQLAMARDDEIGVRTRQARVEAARRAVAAGESGVAGQSIAAYVDDPYSQASQANAMTALQGRMNEEALLGRFRAQKSSIRSQTTGWLEGGLQIAGAGMSGYATGLGIQNSRDQAALLKAGKTVSP